MFVYNTTVKMHDTDAAGILFFGNQFRMVHDAYEKYLEKIGFSFARILRKTNFFIPIVHARADYKAPLFVGDPIAIHVRIARIGTTSFVLEYMLYDAKKRNVGTAKTVHVAINKKTKKKILLPSLFRSALARIK